MELILRKPPVLFNRRIVSGDNSHACFDVLCHRWMREYIEALCKHAFLNPLRERVGCDTALDYCGEARYTRIERLLVASRLLRE